ncbi:threonine aldolase family protein [Marinoscillum furvescens]|nr:GntG family PLP-dependent aldolase [Marinoscillum furvescens]
MIDLRSDTVTKPTPPMLEAMMSAPVGDDVFGDDPSVNQLQDDVAAYFGMEEGLFCPSGTMANQIAIRMHTRPQDEVICHENAHVYLYEGGGMMSNSLVSPKLLPGDYGLLSAAAIAESINPDDIHFPKSRLVCLENTMNKGGGSTYSLETLQAIHKTCVENALALHLDGARLFNALVATGQDPKMYGQLFDSISVCFSKGMGAPVGSVLLGSSTQIAEAKRIRKALGGGMRQAGYLAAACSYALQHHVARLAEDHARAQQLAEALSGKSFVKEVLPVQTNIVIARLVSKTPNELLKELEAAGVLAVSFGKDAIRFVTHLDFSAEQLEQTVSIINKL